MEKEDKNQAPRKAKFSWKMIKKRDMILLFLAGILLVVTTVPNLFLKEDAETGNDNKSNSPASINQTAQDAANDDDYISNCEQKVKKLLSKMEGVGSCEVMITLKSSKEQVVLKDEPYTQDTLNETDKEGGTRIQNQVNNDEKTVLISEKSGESVPYVTKEIEAQIEGVVIVAQGGADGTVATNITRAIEALFNVPAHKIQVLPMTK